MANTAGPSSPTEDTPLVSVLMPCFNHERHVAAALGSIAASTYRRLELVFIDDASRDGSLAAAEAWLAAHRHRFERVVFERHERNRGISATLNELVGHATGHYITFLASDDLLVADGIARQVECAGTRGADYVFADAALIDEQGGDIARSALAYHGRSAKALERRSCLIVDVLLNWESPWTRIFIRADLLRRLGMFDESLRFEDRDFVVRVLIAGSFTFIPEPVYVYRMRIGNRLTPGLDAGGMRADFQRSEAKNCRNASGLIRALLWLNVMAGKVRFDDRGQERKSRVWPLFALIRRAVTRTHLALMG
jgi:glycosyltransferase involved in cell wall biosynthesis